MELPIQVAVRIKQNADGNGNFSSEDKQSTESIVDVEGNGNGGGGFVYTVPADAQRQFDCYMSGGFVQVGDKSFTVTHALPTNCNNSQIFFQTVYPLINLFLEGFDASIVTYGQKGTGKTFTLYGQETASVEFGENEVGIVQHCVREIFAHMSNNEERTYALSIGWVEIYQDTIRDLLGVGNIACKDAAEVYHWLQVGANAKAEMMEETPSYAVHSLFTITLEQQWISKEGLLQHRLSTASFSDLAASERVLVGNALERISIPKDLGLRALEQIVYTLTDPALMYSVNGNIPYNQTALTTLLKDSIGGRAQTLVILCVSALPCDAEETMANLQFAFKLQCVRNFVVMNTFSDNNTPVMAAAAAAAAVAAGRETAAVPGLPGADNFGLQFAASQWLKLVSNAEGLFSKLVSSSAISQLDKEQIAEWLFLKQECEECLSSNEVLRSQKQLRPIQETDEPEETLSEPDISCQQNSDNESDVDSQRADLSEKLETLMEELQIKTDLLVNNKHDEYMQQRIKKKSMESLPQKLNEKPNEEIEERRTSVGGRRRSIHPGTSLSSAELVMLNRVAACEQSSAPVAENALTTCNSNDFLIDPFGSIDIKPLRTKLSPTPIEITEKRLNDLESEIEVKMHAIDELKETMLLKRNIIAEMEKNSDTRTKTKERLDKKKSQLETKREKAKKKLDKALLQGKEKSEITRLEQRLNDLIAIERNIDSAVEQKRKLEQSLQKSKDDLSEMRKELKRDQRQREHLAKELRTLKEMAGDEQHNQQQQQQQRQTQPPLSKTSNDKKKLKEVQARISHLDHVLREKTEKLTDVGLDNSNKASEALRHEINNLRLTRNQMLEERCMLDSKLKRDKILSYREERELLTCDEAIEAIDAVIEFKNELMVGHRSIDTSDERLEREKGEQMLMARLNKLSVEEMRTLLYKYFIKVIDLRDSSRKLETQLIQLERERDTWEWKERALSNAVRQARLEGERNAVLLQREHEMKLTLMLRHFNDETSLSSSSYSEQQYQQQQQQQRPTVAAAAARYFQNPANASATDSDFELDFYKNSLRSKMLKAPKHSEIEMCPSLPDAITKYKPLDRYKDKNKLLAKIQVLTRHAGQTFMPTSNQLQTNNQRDDNGNALQLNTYGGGGGGGGCGGGISMLNATAYGGIGGAVIAGASKKKKDHKNQKETQEASIPQQNLKRLNATQSTTKVTRSKNKIIIQDASRKN